MARTLWDKMGTSTATPEEVAQHLGYNGLNGVSRSKISVLKKYGLLDQAAGGWKLSSRAIVILNSDEGDPKIAAAMLDAFNEVELFRTLYENYPNASKGVISTHLVSQLQFTKDGANAAADSFLESKSVVQSPSYRPNVDSGIGNETPPDKQERMPAAHQVSQPTSVNNLTMEELKIPCSNGASVVLHYPSTMSLTDYELVDTFLKAFWMSKKSAIVQKEQHLDADV